MCLSQTDTFSGILHAARHSSDSTSGLHRLQPLLLLGPDATRGALDLDAGEDRHLLAHHLGCDRARGPADQVGAALGQAERHRPAVLVPKRAGVVAEQAHRSVAAGQADVLLDLLLSCL